MCLIVFEFSGGGGSDWNIEEYHLAGVLFICLRGGSWLRAWWDGWVGLRDLL